MTKVHVVREPFNIDGVDYMRGAEITDAATVEKIKALHPKRLIQRHHDATPTPPAPKADAPKPAAAPPAPAAQ